MRAKNGLMVLVIITIISLITIGCSSSSTNTTNQKDGKEDETVTLRVATYFAGTSPIYTAVTEPWMKRVTELTDGNVQFDYYPGEQLGKAADLLNLTRDRVTDISVFPSNYAPDTMPLTNMLAGLPNLSETSYQGSKAYHDLLQENTQLLEMEYLKNGVRPILTNVSPTYEIWTTGKEIRVPEDLKGLKVRTAGGVANELYEFMGATPVAIPFPETYEALDKGVIDALSLYSLGLENGGIDEITSYGIFPHIGTAIQSVIINEKTWQGLSEETKKAMIQASEEIMESSGETYAIETNKFNEKFKKNGGTIAELTPEEQEKWKKVTEEFTQDWLKEHKSDPYPYEEVLDMYIENIKQYK